MGGKSKCLYSAKNCITFKAHEVIAEGESHPLKLLLNMAYDLVTSVYTPIPMLLRTPAFFSFPHSRPHGTVFMRSPSPLSSPSSGHFSLNEYHWISAKYQICELCLPTGPIQWFAICITFCWKINVHGGKYENSESVTDLTVVCAPDFTVDTFTPESLKLCTFVARYWIVVYIPCTQVHSQAVT